MSGRTTIYDIARAAEVSHMTVSLALRDSPRISDARKAEIRRLAARMGYYPQTAGRLLRARRTRQLGAVVAEQNHVTAFGSNQIGRMLDGFICVCRDHDYGYQVDFHHHSEDMDQFLPPATVAGGLVDGVALIGDVGEALREWLATQSIPWVSVMEPAPFSVISADDEAFEAMVDELVGLGHRRIALQTGPLRYATFAAQRNGVLRGLRRHGIEVPEGWLSELPMTDLPAREAAKRALAWAGELLDADPRPTAILCHGDGRYVVQAALERGLRLPRDLSLVGRAHAEHAAWQFPALTAIEMDYEQMAAEAMALLLELLQAGTAGVERPQRRVPADFIAGESVGPAPA